MQLRFVNPNIVELRKFQVVGGQLRIDSFGREEVRLLSLIAMTLTHYTFDGKCISFPLMHYVDSLFMRSQLIR